MTRPSLSLSRRPAQKRRRRAHSRGRRSKTVCSACGSPIYSQAEATKHMVSIRCGTLDGDPEIRPSVHAYVASKAPWLSICDDIRQLPAGIAG